MAKRRTWHWFQDRRRAPSEYEELTVGLQWHTPPVVQTDLGSWSQDSTALVNVEWEDFRDPAKLYYRTYVAIQDKSETQLDGIVGLGTSSIAPDRLASEWVTAARDVFAGMAFAEWAIAMLNQTVQRFCLSSTLAAAAQLQVVDKFRRAERLLEWADVLVVGDGSDEEDPARAAWMSSPALQPLRAYLEEALVLDDWGEIIVAVNVALETQLQPFLLEVYSGGGRAYGDFVSTGLGEAFAVDTGRHEGVARAALDLALRADEANRATIAGWLATWAPRADEVVRTLADAHPLGGLTANALSSAGDHHRTFLDELADGALRDAPTPA